MRNDFYQYFERELAYLRRFGAEFGRKYPSVAARLNLEPDRCDDPHVERLLEAFAFLAARIHLRLDDDFPEVSSALLNVLYPQLCRPMPSMAIIQFQMDPEVARLTATQTIEPGKELLSTRSAEGRRCRFRTCYRTQLHPILVEDARWAATEGVGARWERYGRTAAVIRLRLRCCPGVSFSGLDIDSVRFFLSGTSDLVHRLYELIHSRCHTVLLHDPDRRNSEPVRLAPNVIAPVGFDPEEVLWSAPARTFAGYQLIQEYFAFPWKFLFFDLRGIASEMSRLGAAAEFSFLIGPFEQTEWRQDLELGVSADTFRLGCTPAINLFPHQPLHPVRLEQTRYEYPLTVENQMEIYSVESVAGRGPRSATDLIFDRFYDFRASARTGGSDGYWYARRRSPFGDREGLSEVVLSIVDNQGSPVNPGVDALTVRLYCTDGQLPSRIDFGDGTADFSAAVAGVSAIVCMRRPTERAVPPSAGSALWHLISQLSLNHRSLVDEGAVPLKWLLQLQNLTGAAFATHSIEGIQDVLSTPDFARVDSEYGAQFVRGKRVEIEVDESRFAGSGAYLFGAVIERFLGAYTSLNSFTRLILRSRQRTVGEFPPRAGNRVVA